MDFQFKQFSITQENTAMKVGTDAVLLGAWSKTTEGNILDIGTGTGLIALMLAQRTQTALIDTIEIDEATSKEAQENFIKSNWKNRLTSINSSLQDFHPSKRFDLIISNPPFFIDATKAPENKRNTARHSDSLSFYELIKAVKHLLADNAFFSLILPINEAKHFIEIAFEAQLYLNRKCMVKPNPTKAAKRVLMELSFNETTIIEEELTIETEKRHIYTEEYITLTKDFYLKF
ncbi:MAG: methyltransferase [Vicingaceae bacterium]|nr:methyltransferase [Vicingaceae bacterium]